MKKRIESDEIELVEVIINIWNNKLKIAAITTIFIIVSIAYYFVKKPPLIAKTEILPITNFENNLYAPYNSLLTPQAQSDDEKIPSQQKLNKIDKDYLLSLFLEELQTKEVVIEAIKIVVIAAIFNLLFQILIMTSIKSISSLSILFFIF